MLRTQVPGFPTAPGLLLGVGLGGFVDGIALWDLGFLALGLALVLGGLSLVRSAVRPPARAVAG